MIKRIEKIIVKSDLYLIELVKDLFIKIVIAPIIKGIIKGNT